MLTWNIRDLGKSKEIRFIAQTIINADIVALQEMIAGKGGAQAVARIVFNPLKSQGYKPLLVGQKTSLKQTCQANDCLASEYDNIFYLSNMVQIHDKGIIQFYKQTETFEAACGYRIMYLCL